MADAAALNALAAHLEKSNVKIARGSRALADERRVKDLIVFSDPIGNRLEVFHGPEVAPSRSSRAARSPVSAPARSAWATPCSPPNASTRSCRSIRKSSISRRPTIFCKPFKAYFFHINARHHSLAFIDTGKNGIHHMMFEVCYLDDVGQAYDLALRKPEMIGTTLGRHVNDHVTSFYSYSPSKFLVEYGWGGRSIEPRTGRRTSAPRARAFGVTTACGLRRKAANEARDLRVRRLKAAAASRSMSWTAIICAPATSVRGGMPTCRRARPADFAKQSHGGRRNFFPHPLHNFKSPSL